jgi:hypothetical protein
VSRGGTAAPSSRDPQTSALRDGSFRADLTHELGHAIVAHHVGVTVTSVVVRNIALVDGELRVRGGCSIEWWAGLGVPGKLAVMSVAGMVAEMLDRAEDPRRDPLALLRSDVEFAGDLEDALIYLQRRFRGATQEKCEMLIPRAVDEAHAILAPRLAAIRAVVTRFDQHVRETRCADLTIAWSDDDDALLAELQLV